MQEITKNMNGKCVSTVYVKNATKLRWQWINDHTWDETLAHVKYGSWCTYCAWVYKLTIEEMQKLAKSKSGKCLSREYKGNKIKLKWKCKEERTFSMKSNSVQQGQWCRICTKPKGKYEEFPHK